MKDWEEMEEVVKYLEKAISPDAFVERNVNLPCLTSSIGSTRQCDIVIRQGRPARQTISIVEVQKRNRKVDLNTFGGWCEKLREVGAQHLICVSKIGFPKSIIERAQQAGPSVRLLTLKEIESSEKWPINFLSNTIKNPRRNLVSIENAYLNYEYKENTEKHGFDVNLSEKIFEINGIRLSAFEVFFGYMDYLEGSGQVFDSGLHEIEIKLPVPGMSISCEVNGVVRKVLSFSATYKVDVLNRNISIKKSKYEQIEYAGVLAWLLKANVYQNDRECELQMVLIPEDEGHYRLSLRMAS